MRLRMSAASLSSMTVATAGGAPLGEAAVVWRYCANVGRKQESAKPKGRARECRRVMAPDIARTLPARQLRAKRKRPRPNRPGALLRYVVAGLRWECR